MKFLIIIPAHNEEQNILFCLKSLEMQAFQDFNVVVVNDGSTDGTTEVLNDFSKNTDLGDRLDIITLPASEHQPGAKVVRTFDKGLKTLDLSGFDIICKFDADIVFPPNYLLEVEKVYRKNPKAGMVSGLVKIRKSLLEYQLMYDFDDVKRQWTYENLSSKDHVRGPIKSYRKECFLAMNGLRPVLGWDNIDVMLARMHGFEVMTIKNIWVKHLRPTAYKYRNQKAEKLGEYFYNIGLNFPLAVISSAKSAMKGGRFRDFFITMKSFLKQNSARTLSKDEIQFIRKLRWTEMWNKIF